MASVGWLGVLVAVTRGVCGAWFEAGVRRLYMATWVPMAQAVRQPQVATACACACMRACTACHRRAPAAKGTAEVDHAGVGVVWCGVPGSLDAKCWQVLGERWRCNKDWLLCWLLGSAPSPQPLCAHDRPCWLKGSSVHVGAGWEGVAHGWRVPAGINERGAGHMAGASGAPLLQRLPAG